MSQRPRLEACYFNTPEDRSFTRLAHVLERTAADHCPTWDRTVIEIPRPRFRTSTGVPSHAHNIQKFDHWAQVVQDASNGDRIVLLDADVAIIRPLDDIWDYAFDFAYTTKAHRFQFNLGVLFLRVSNRTGDLFARWQAQNRSLLEAPDKARAWRMQYGGINQAAFGQLLEAGALEQLSVRTFPCQEWNCEESAWASFDPAVTRILHVKGALRRALFGCEKVTPERAAAVRYWHELDRQAHHREQTA